jgi:hypothetical protein
MYSTVVTWKPCRSRLGSQLVRNGTIGLMPGCQMVSNGFQASPAPISLTFTRHSTPEPPQFDKQRPLKSSRTSKRKLNIMDKSICRYGEYRLKGLCHKMNIFLTLIIKNRYFGTCADGFNRVIYIKIRLNIYSQNMRNRKRENPAKLHCKKFAKFFLARNPPNRQASVEKQ